MWCPATQTSSPHLPPPGPPLSHPASLPTLPLRPLALAPCPRPPTFSPYPIPLPHHSAPLRSQQSPYLIGSAKAKENIRVVGYNLWGYHTFHHPSRQHWVSYTQEIPHIATREHTARARHRQAAHSSHPNQQLSHPQNCRRHWVRGGSRPNFIKNVKSFSVSTVRCQNWVTPFV